MRVLFQIFIGLGIFLVCGCKVSQFDTLEKVENSNSIWMMAYMPGASFYIPPNSSYCFDGVTYWSGENRKTLHHCTGYEVKPHKEEERVTHSDDWFSQQRLAEHLCTLTQEEFEIFVRTFLFTESDWEELGEMKEK